MNTTPENVRRNDKIRVGITHGDINGISYEIIIKSLMDQRVLEMFTPIVYGHSKVASYYRKSIGVSEFMFNMIKHPDAASTKKPNMISCYDEEVKIEMGKVSPVAGKLAIRALEMATEDLRKGLIDVIVTSPVNKKNIQSEIFHFRGHTEYLAKEFNCSDYLMLMVSGKFRVGVVTGHIPLKDVPGVITEELIKSKINVLNDSLIRDFGVRKPRIAVLGLNPHAGEDGLLGDEEKKFIIPAINKAFNEGILVFGTYPADGFFGSENFQKFDGILAMYHDQGMIPFKSLSFQDGVNYTAGLPVIRTSPAHGTAYELAGKNMASPDSLCAAIYLAIDIYKKRIEFEEISENPLQLSMLEEENNVES